jgi:carbon-monoxide dehydrogenase large subunit
MAAVANAVEDALRGYDVVVRRCPLSPDRIRALIRGGTVDARRQLE